MLLDQRKEKQVSSIFLSFVYVKNWHCFYICPRYGIKITSKLLDQNMYREVLCQIAELFYKKLISNASREDGIRFSE